MNRNKKIVVLLGTACVWAGYAGVAEAKSVKNLLSSSLLSSFCSEAGIDSNNMVSVSLPDGGTAVGSVHCEAEDVVASVNDDGIDTGIDDDEDGSGHRNRGRSAGDDDDDHEDDEDDDRGSGSNSGSGSGDDGGQGSDSDEDDGDDDDDGDDGDD